MWYEATKFILNPSYISKFLFGMLNEKYRKFGCSASNQKCNEKLLF